MAGAETADAVAQGDAVGPARAGGWGVAPTRAPRAPTPWAAAAVLAAAAARERHRGKTGTLAAASVLNRTRWLPGRLSGWQPEVSTPL